MDKGSKGTRDEKPGDASMEQAIDAFAVFINLGKTMPQEAASVIYGLLKVESVPNFSVQDSKENLLERFDALVKARLLALDMANAYMLLPNIPPKQPPPMLGLVGGLWYLHALIHENMSTHEANAIQNNLHHASEMLDKMTGIKAMLPKEYRRLHASGKSMRRYVFKYAVPWLVGGRMPERKGRFKAVRPVAAEQVATQNNVDNKLAIAETSAKSSEPTNNRQADIPAIQLKVTTHQLHEWCVTDNKYNVSGLASAIKTEALHKSLAVDHCAIAGDATLGKTTLLRQNQREQLRESESIVIYASAERYRDFIRNPYRMAAYALFDATGTRDLLPNDVNSEDIENSLKAMSFTLLVDDGDKLINNDVSVLLRGLTRLPESVHWLVVLSSNWASFLGLAGWSVMKVVSPSVLEAVRQIRHEVEQPQHRHFLEHLIFRSAPILQTSHLSINIACQTTIVASAGIRWRALSSWLDNILRLAPNKADHNAITRLLNALAFNATSSPGNPDAWFSLEAVEAIPRRKLAVQPEHEMIQAAVKLGLLVPQALDGSTHFTYPDLRRYLAAQAWLQQVISTWEMAREQKRKVLIWNVATTSTELNEMLSERWQTTLADAVAISIAFLDDNSRLSRDIYSNQHAKLFTMLRERLETTKPSTNVKGLWPKLPVLDCAISQGLANEQLEMSALKVLADQYPVLLARLAASWRLLLVESLRAEQLAVPDTYVSLRLLSEMNALPGWVSNEEIEADEDLVKAVARRIIYEPACINISEYQLRLHHDFPNNLPEAAMRAHFLSYGSESLDQLLRLACKPNYTHRPAAVRCLVYGALLSPGHAPLVNYDPLIEQAFQLGTPEIQAEMIGYLLGNPFDLRWEPALRLATSLACVLEHHQDLLSDACRRHGAATAMLFAKQTLFKQREGLAERTKTILKAIANAATSPPQSEILRRLAKHR